MKRNRIRSGTLSLMLILMSACAAPESSGITAKESNTALPEGQSFGAGSEDTVLSVGQPFSAGSEDTALSGAQPLITSLETKSEGTVSDISQEMASESGGESNRAEPGSDQTAGTQETMPEKGFQSDSEKETSIAAYRQTVEESDAGMVFSLINLDEDEIPELAVGDRGNGKCSIYTIKDGTVFCLVDSMTTEELVYFERSGIIAVFTRWNGGGDEGGYGRQYYQTSVGKTIADGDSPFLSYSYNAVYDENGVYTGKGVTDYFYVGQEMDEPMYYEILEMLGIMEDGGKLCLENAVLAEEMLDILK